MSITHNSTRSENPITWNVEIATKRQQQQQQQQNSNNNKTTRKTTKTKEKQQQPQREDSLDGSSRSFLNWQLTFICAPYHTWYRKEARKEKKVYSVQSYLEKSQGQVTFIQYYNLQHSSYNMGGFLHKINCKQNYVPNKALLALVKPEWKRKENQYLTVLSTVQDKSTSSLMAD